MKYARISHLSQGVLSTIVGVSIHAHFTLFCSVSAPVEVWRLHVTFIVNRLVYTELYSISRIINTLYRLRVLSPKP